MNYREITNDFSCDAEGVQTEDGFVTRGTCQPHARCSLHTCAQMVACDVDGLSVQPSTWHLYTLLILPNLRQRGIIWVGIVTSRASGAAGEGTSSSNPNFSMAGVEASGVASQCSYGGMEMVAVGDWWHFLGQHGMEDREECGMAPHKSPYKPSASDPVTVDWILPNPSNHCASSLSLITHCNKPKPQKEKGKCNLTCQT